MCCEDNGVESGPCCGDGCCTEAETCCADDKGWVCCMQQNGACVPKVAGFPARCCPRWTVGCTIGSVGCCDPAQPWQWALAKTHRKMPISFSKSSASTLTQSPRAVPASTGDNVTSVHAIFVTELGLAVMNIDTATGRIHNRAKVKHFNDDPAGESTREYLYDPTRGKFFYLDSNFTADGGRRPATGRPFYLYTLDPATGESTQRTVSGAKEFPTGFVMHGEKILVATEVCGTHTQPELQGRPLPTESVF